MPFDARFALNTLLPLTEGSYGVPPLLIAPWQLVQTIQPGNAGYLATSGESLLLAFRGTETTEEWLEDFAAIAVPNAFGEGLVHVGFAQAYQRIRQSVIDALQSIKQPLPLIITGHSLGAAVALLCAGDLARSGWKPTVYTWGGPRVGMHGFAHWLESLLSEIYRVDNMWDIICHVPSCIRGFEHAGLGISIDGGFARERIAHSLEFGYRPGLERLIASSSSVPIAKIA